MLTTWKVKIYADGADLKSMKTLAANPHVKGFTTNPSLVRKAGVTDYEAFARETVAAIPNHPISFEVFADENSEMEAQALEIATWGKNVYVKIPVTNTKGVSTAPIISRLSRNGVALNITALFTERQVREVVDALDPASPAVISVFAGRIADTGVDPLPTMKACAGIVESKPKAELLWASTRELVNIEHAEQAGCHIITVPTDLIDKLKLVGKDLTAYSLETVKGFYQDATAAGYRIVTKAR